MEYVTIVNRTKRVLEGTWDGRTYQVQPGETPNLPLAIAEAIKRRNPIMGSDDYTTGALQYLVAIKEQGDPTEPVEQSKEIELFSSRRLRGAVPVVVIPGAGGLYTRNDTNPGITGPGSVDVVGFEKP
jgi:hypothetical protein